MDIFWILANSDLWSGAGATPKIWSFLALVWFVVFIGFFVDYFEYWITYFMFKQKGEMILGYIMHNNSRKVRMNWISCEQVSCLFGIFQIVSESLVPVVGYN